MQLIFGIGALWGTRNDTSGIGPDQFAILQDNSIDFSFELKELYSQLQFPVDIARGKGKITGKAKMARVFGALYADLFFGATAVTGESNVSEDELQTAAGTVVVSQAASFVADLGVYYQNNIGGTVRKRMSYVNTPTLSQGSYNVNGGTYNFALADYGQQVAVSYVFTDVNGKTITLTNNFMGFTPTFIGTFYAQRSTQGSSGQLTLRLNECVSNHLTIPNRLDDYAIMDLDFQAFSPGNNIIGTLSTTE